MHWFLYRVHRTGLEPVRANADGLEDRNASNYVLTVLCLISHFFTLQIYDFCCNKPNKMNKKVLI